MKRRLHHITTLLVAPTLASTALAQFPEAIHSDPSLGDAQFGFSIDLHYDTLVVGAPSYSSHRGTAQIFKWNSPSESFQFHQTINIGSLSSGDSYGRAVAATTNLIAVAAPFDTAGGVGSAGSVAVHVPQFGNPDFYMPAQILRASDPLTSAGFGTSVDVIPGWAFVGSPEHPGLALPIFDSKGIVYAYRKGASSWNQTETQRLHPISTITSQRFGESLAVDEYNQVLAVGAPNGGSFHGNPGSVHVYELSGGSWGAVERVGQPSNDAKGFGRAVAIEDGLLVVGAPVEEVGGEAIAGKVYVFAYNAINGYTLIQELQSPSPHLDQQFGRAVDMDNKRLIVGTANEHAFVYSHVPINGFYTWQLAGDLTASDGVYGNAFGRSVAAGRMQQVVGANQAPSSGSSGSGGQVYVYGFPSGFASYCAGADGPCPCGNDDPLAGCANSTGSGAFLLGSGSTNPADEEAQLAVSGLPEHKPALLFSGNTATSTPLLDGRLCVTGGIQRLAVRLSGSEGSAVFGHEVVLGATGLDVGETLYFQCWYRDAGGPCGTGSNLSNAVEVISL